MPRPVQPTLEGKIGMSITRIVDMVQYIKDNNKSKGMYNGAMFCLTIFYEEFTGKTMEDNLSPKEVYAWAVSLAQRGRVQ